MSDIKVRLGSENAVRVVSTTFSSSGKLYELSDVDISNGQNDGMVLVFNSDILKWQSTSNPVLKGTLTLEGDSIFGKTITNTHSFLGITTFFGDVTLGEIKISSNIISSVLNSQGKIYIDPYPDNLNNQGTVIVKGNLRVDGNETTINQPFLNLSDVVSIRTVSSPSNIGDSIIFIDSIVGINTGDTVSGSPFIPNGSAVIQSYNSLTNSITINKSLTGLITPLSEIVINHNYNKNTDRGITFDYNTISGISTNKKGFFGYKDDTGYFTFIPDATISNNAISGVKGTIDVGAIILNFQNSGISTRGAAYFDSSGKLTSTKTPEFEYFTSSNYILTTNNSNVPVWTNKIDGGKY